MADSGWECWIYSWNGFDWINSIHFGWIPLPLVMTGATFGAIGNNPWLDWSVTWCHGWNRLGTRKPRHATCPSGTHRSIAASGAGEHGRTTGEFGLRWSVFVHFFCSKQLKVKRSGNLRRELEARRGKLSKVGTCVIHGPETVFDVIVFKIF